jgi:hypothetical protein
MLTPESLESNCKGHNPLDWGFPHIIGKILEFRCLKWARMTHMDIWNTSYAQKKGWESNWQIDSRPLKVKNQPNFLACRCCATYRWKPLDEGYNFFSNLIPIRGLHTKLWPHKVMEFWEFWNSHLGVPGQDAIWMWALWRGTKYNIRGKVVASPKSPWWVLGVQVCSWFVLTPKVLQRGINQLVIWFCACPCEWINAYHSS